MTAEDRASELAQAIVEETADALMAVDGTGTITAWNPAAGQPLGRRADAAIARTPALLIPKSNRQRHIDGSHSARESARTDTHGAPVTLEAVRADGSTVQLAIVIGLLNDDGRAHGAVAALRPAGERRPLTSRAPTGSER